VGFIHLPENRVLRDGLGSYVNCPLHLEHAQARPPVESKKPGVLARDAFLGYSGIGGTAPPDTVAKIEHGCALRVTSAAASSRKGLTQTGRLAEGHSKEPGRPATSETFPVRRER
jgi:hypothetical protein